MTAALHVFPLADAGAASGDQLPAWFHDEPGPAETALDELPSGEFPIVPDPAADTRTTAEFLADGEVILARLRAAMTASRTARGADHA
jgi:hypothetical protein